MWRLKVGCVFLGLTILIAITGYVAAGWGWVDAIYMVTITIFGVGYGEVQPVTHAGMKLFTIAVIIAGCSSGLFVIGGILQLVTEGEVRRMLGIQNRVKEMNSLNNHAIICGYGRVGKMLAKNLVDAGQSLIILDQNPGRVDQAIQDGLLAISGDAVDDSVLIEAGIDRAKSLSTVLPNDAMNVFITLSARDLNESIQIIARAESPATERKLFRSGATRVVMPAAIGAMRIAQLITDGQTPDAVSESDDSCAIVRQELDNVRALGRDVDRIIRST